MTNIKSLIVAGLLATTAMTVACGSSHIPAAQAETAVAAVQTQQTQSSVRYGTETVNGVDVFYREAGNPSKPTLVLLHGFPSSSHMYRTVLAELGDEYHIIAPDYPGFGNSAFPSPDNYTYTFDNLADTIDGLLEQKGISRYTFLIQDYGAPVGMRIATEHPERVAGIISMNGNVYEEGLSVEGWGPVMKYWDDKSPELEKTITENVFTLGAMQWQYTHGTRNPDALLPDSWRLDYQNLSRPGQHEVQLQLFYDYQNNVQLYPSWQKYLRENQPPVLAVWGKNDAFFPPAGAEGFKRDVKDAEVYLLDTGHFPLEEDSEFIIGKVRGFMAGLERK